MQWMTGDDRAERGAAGAAARARVPRCCRSTRPTWRLLETQEWSPRDLANAYGVPSVLLNMALQGGLTYQNPSALMQMWWLTELRTTAKRIVDAFTAQLLPRGQWVTPSTRPTSRLKCHRGRMIRIVASDFGEGFAGAAAAGPGISDRRLNAMSDETQPRWRRCCSRRSEYEKSNGHSNMLVMASSQPRSPPGEGRTVDVRIVPYGERISHNDGLGGVRSRCRPTRRSGMPGVFAHQLNAAFRVHANVEHEQGSTARSVTRSRCTTGPTGSTARSCCWKRNGGRDGVAVDSSGGALDGVSMEAQPVKSTIQWSLHDDWYEQRDEDL